MAHIDQVQPPLKFIPPEFNPWVLRSMKFLSPYWLERQSAIKEIQVQHPERLVEQFAQFYQGKTRLLIAFRHPSVDDPLVLLQLFSRLLPKFAQQQHVSLPKLIHCHFLYDRGIPLWAGPWIGWLFSQLGGVPIQRGKLDLVALKTARKLLVEGKFPFAAAPEGATNGHSEIVSPIEPGVAQLGFWAMEDIENLKQEDIIILPLGLRYQYVTPPWAAIDQLLTELETNAGMAPLKLESASAVVPEINTNQTLAHLKPHEKLRYARLYRLGQNCVEILEDYYARFYQKTFKPNKASLSEPESPNEPNLKLTLSNSQDENALFRDRLQALLDTVLNVAEEFFSITPKGGVIDRCRRLEQAGWSRIYRDDLGELQTLSPLEKGLANRIAEEASLRLWHMRLVENVVAVTGQYVRQKPTVERFAETSLLMWELMARIKSGDSGQPPRLGVRQVTIKVGEPIPVSAYWTQYKQSRREAKRAVETLTAELQQVFENLITD
ncbi:MAG: 1-acyl-sn-glycerol-3-phosphate acyltransferase [Cyanobacteria bacterium P01_H01_bin.15]